MENVFGRDRPKIDFSQFQVRAHSIQACKNNCKEHFSTIQKRTSLVSISEVEPQACELRLTHSFFGDYNIQILFLRNEKREKREIHLLMQNFEAGMKFDNELHIQRLATCGLVSIVEISSLRSRNLLKLVRELSTIFSET